jgi:hypothetical protein
MGPTSFHPNCIPSLPLSLAVLVLLLTVLAAGCQSNSSAPKEVSVASAESPILVIPPMPVPSEPAAPRRLYRAPGPPFVVPGRPYPVLPFRATPGLPRRLEPRDFAAPNAPYVYVLPESGVFAMSPFAPPRVRIVPNRAMPSVPMPTTPGPRGVAPIPLLEMHGYPGGIPPVPMPALDSSPCAVPSTSGR